MYRVANGIPIAVLAIACAIAIPLNRALAQADGLDRTVLPVPEPQRPPITELDVRKAKAPPSL
jgi:hypothetical protein